MARKSSGGRKPRGPRSPRRASARKSTQRANESGKANRAVRSRLVQLETRVTVLELFLGLHMSQPPLQDQLSQFHDEPTEEE